MQNHRTRNPSAVSVEAHARSALRRNQNGQPVEYGEPLFAIE
jgi:hypothetical protein